MQSFAKKVGMTHYYDDKGVHQVATVLELQKTICAGERTQDKDGYEAKIYALSAEKDPNKHSVAGQFKEIENVKRLKELKDDKSEAFESGKEVVIGSFAEGDKITLRGISKGKGFAGTVKRHSFNTGPKTHGSNNYRQPGSIGDTGPGHVVKGKKMGGRMGFTNVKIKLVSICKVEAEKNRIWVKSPVPGANKSTIIIEKND